jgi:thermostable 8-oxoguanine DNA glycosylase
MRTRKATEIVASTARRDVNRYMNYWHGLKPHSHNEYRNMWFFSYASVRTTVKSNLKLFEELRDLRDDITEPELRQLLINARAGMINVRTKGIHDFIKRFKEDPTIWYPRDDETWIEARDRLSAQIYGLGIAKTSFVLEMAYPDTCEVLCVDTHIRSLYSVDPDDLNDKTYRRIERHWVRRCKKRKIPVPLARHIYWDSLRGKRLNDYWAHCLDRKWQNAQLKSYISTGTS